DLPVACPPPLDTSAEWARLHPGGQPVQSQAHRHIAGSQDGGQDFGEAAARTWAWTELRSILSVWTWASRRSSSQSSTGPRAASSTSSARSEITRKKAVRAASIARRRSSGVKVP